MKKNKDQRRITLVVGMYFCPCGITWIELEQSPMGIHYLSFACLTFVPTYQRFVPFISYRSNRFWLQKKKFKELLSQNLKRYLMITCHASTEDTQISQTWNVAKIWCCFNAPPSSYIKWSQTLILKDSWFEESHWWASKSILSFERQTMNVCQGCKSRGTRQDMEKIEV